MSAWFPFGQLVGPSNPEERRSLTQALLSVVRQDDFDRSYCCGCGLFAGSCIFVPMMLMVPLFLPLALIPIWKGVSENRVNMLRAEAITSLAALSDPGAIRDVALALWRPDGARISPGDKSIRESAEAAFPNLAATLTSDMYGRMHGETIKVICRALYHPSVTVKMSALKALRTVAGGEAVKAVEMFYAEWRLPVWPVPEDVQIEVKETLEVLRARRANERESARLLRPAQAPYEANQHLLRPLDRIGEADPQRLLRPAQEGQGESAEQSQEGHH